MSYHVHHTEAVILGGHPVGEGDRLLRCYTRELGLIFARATSVREQRSRLRYALQTFTHVEVDVIRGKHGWKLISARPVDSFSELWMEPSRRLIAGQYLHLLSRLIQGEEQQEEVFDELLSAMYFLRQLHGDDELRDAELVFVVRTLSLLGYWNTPHDEALFSGAWSPLLLAHARRDRTTLLAEVNRALAASQL